MADPHSFPAVRGAGLFLIISGAAVAIGGFLGEQRMYWAFAAGLAAGYIPLVLFAKRLGRSLGTVTKPHWQAIRGAALLMIALTSIATKVFRDDLLRGDTRAYSLSLLFALAISFTMFAVAAGPLMLLLAALCIVNAAIGVFAPVPMNAVWLMNGLLEIGIGIAMLRAVPARAQEPAMPSDEFRKALVTVRQIVDQNKEWRDSRDPAKGPFTEDAVVRELERSARDAILLKPEALAAPASPPVRSFFGGLPKLPPQLAWPTKSGEDGDRDLTFIGQIDLGELPRSSGSPLPASGTLYFFLDLSKEWLEDGDAAVLFHGDPAATLVATQAPHSNAETAATTQYAIRFLAFRSHRSWLIDPAAKHFPARRYTAIHRRLQSQSLEAALGPGSGTVHDTTPESLNQMLGYGEVVQSTPIDRVDDVLLLQVTSDMYGQFWPESDPCGVIQFWISTADLAARRFERVGVNFDCT